MSPIEMPPPAPDTIVYVNAWRKNDPKLEAEAIAFWSTLEALPEGVNPQERVKQLAVMAYDGGKLIAISTVNVAMFEQVRQKMGFLREIVLAEHQRHSVGRDLGFETRKVIEAYALAHPEEQIGGMASILQSPGTGKRAIGRKAKMALIGYTAKNEQVRIGWFDHFTVPANNPTA